MASALETENHVRDMEFKKAMHGKSAAEQNHFMAWMQKDKGAQKEAVDEYFKHWDNKAAKDETEEVREVSRYLDCK
jgi:sterol 24-C-methyltransferase